MPAGEKRSRLQRQISDWLENAEAVNAKLKMFERDDKLGRTLVAPSSSPKLAIPQTSNAAGEASIFQSCSSQ